MIRMRVFVRKALESAEIDDRDQAAVALVRRYAELMDAPGMPAKYRTHFTTLAILVDAQGNGLHQTAIDAIGAALSEQTVASDLGPKLLAGLHALGLTVAARNDKGRGVVNAPSPARAKHDELKARRQRRAASVDPASS